MRYFILILGLLIVMVAIFAGLRGGISRKPPIEIFPDMVRQAKLRPQTFNEFFPDRMSSRLPVPGTVVRAEPLLLAGKAVYPFEDSPVNTGRFPGTTNFVETNPLPVTEALLARGQERFDMYCAPCHGAQGDGKGITSKLGMSVVGDLHDSKVRKVVQQPDGELFNTITHGKNLMSAYNGLLPVQDRWAVIAYVRALERSRLATIQDVPASDRGQLPNVPPAASSPAPVKPLPSPSRAGNYP